MVAVCSYPAGEVGEEAGEETPGVWMGSTEERLTASFVLIIHPQKFRFLLTTDTDDPEYHEQKQRHAQKPCDDVAKNAIHDRSPG
jgi:hypothetical protein